MEAGSDEEMCDLDTLEALLNSDDDARSTSNNEDKSANIKVNSFGQDKNPGTEKTGLSKELADFMNAESDDSDDGELSQDKASNVKVAKRNPADQDKITPQSSLASSVSDQNPSSMAAMMVQMAEMQKKMEELQQRLLSQQQNEEEKNETIKRKTSLSSQKSAPVSKMSLMDDEDAGNLFFSSNDSKASTSSKQSKSSAKKSSPDICSKKTVSTKTSAKTLKEDSDSDWEDLDGDNKSGLSEHGKSIKRLLKMGEKRKGESESNFSSASPSDSSISREQNKKVRDVKDIGASVNRKSVDGDKHSLQCSSSYTEQSKSATQKSAANPEKIVIEDFSRIRIVNPLISSSVMKMRMEDRKLISVSRIHAKLNTPDLQGDWVTIGVMVGKTDAKASSTGKPYSIWKLSDLHDLDNTASFFLFGQVHKNHWKLDIGSVIGILNPSMMEALEKNKGDPAFTIKNPNQLMVMGLSKDLGWCAGHTKKGNKCSHFLNKRQGDYCSYHVQAEYKKVSSQRLEFHGSVNGIKPKSFEQKIFSKNCAYMYGGSTFIPNNSADKPKKKLTLSKLQEKAALDKRTNTLSIQNIKPSTETTVKSGKISESDSDLFMDMITVPSPGSMNLVAHLKKNENRLKGSPKDGSPGNSATGSKTMESVSAGDLLKQHRQQMRMRQKSKPKASELLLSSGNSHKSPVSSPSNPLKEKPVLGKGLGSGQDISLTFTGRSSALSLADKSKIKAIQALHSKGKGSIEKEDPNAVRKLKGEKKMEAIKKRVHNGSSPPEGEETPGCSKSRSSQEPKAKKSRLLGDVDLNSAEVKAILKAKSKHVGALAEKEAEREEMYFEGLEKKEKLEEKLQSVTSIEINVFTCKQCHYTAQSALEQCKQEQHSIVKSKSKKRFFACKKCKHRANTINGMFPSSPCQKCGSLGFEKTSMYREKTGPKLESEVLSLRGDEVKFINSLDHKVFMNTVVD